MMDILAKYNAEVRCKGWRTMLFLSTDVKLAQIRTHPLKTAYQLDEIYEKNQYEKDALNLKFVSSTSPENGKCSSVKTISNIKKKNTNPNSCQ
jgi:hypothetical protein